MSPSPAARRPGPHRRLRPRFDRLERREVPALFTNEFPVVGPSLSTPDLVVEGPDGNVWFTDSHAGGLGRITPTGAVSAFMTGPPSQEQSSYGVTVFPAHLSGLAAGPDGNIWFTQAVTTESIFPHMLPRFSVSNSIGLITPAGDIKTFPGASYGFTVLPGPNPHRPIMGPITAGPDGALWFTEGSQVERITTAFDLTRFPTTLSRDPAAITTGPDANIWIAESGKLGGAEAGPAEIARVTTSGAITEFALPATSGDPTSIAVGPDGDLWFTETGDPARHTLTQVGRITPGGTITEFPVGPGQDPTSLTPGPDGDLWFTDALTGQVGRLSTAGVVTEPATIRPPTGPAASITLGPGGDLWFSEPGNHLIGQATPGGAWQEFPTRVNLSTPVPSPPSAITAGPDGALWLGLPSSGAVGRMTTTGQLTVFPLPDPGTLVTSLVGSPMQAGRDPAVWFAEQSLVGTPFAHGRIGRITPGGAITEFAIPGPPALPDRLVARGDGSYWFTAAYRDAAGGEVGRVAPDGTISLFPLPVGPDGPQKPFAITVGADGNLWFLAGRAVIQMTPAGAFRTFPIPLLTPDAIPGDLTTGPDGNFWISIKLHVNHVPDEILRMTPSAAFTSYFLPFVSVPFGRGPLFDPGILTASPSDGNVWFTGQVIFRQLGRITPHGAISVFPVPTDLSNLTGLAAGPDGNIWFIDQPDSVGGKAGVGELVLANILSAAGTTIRPTAYTMFTGPVATFTTAALNSSPIDFAAAINWGDGSPPSAAAIVADGRGGYTVVGSHVYRQAGTYPVAAVILDFGRAYTTAAGSASVAPAATTQVTGWSWLGAGRRPTQLALAFSSALDPTRARDPANYRLAAPGRPGTRAGRPIPIASIAYQAGSDVVVLTPGRRLRPGRAYQLTVVGTPPGGLTGALGEPLAGGGGQPGTDALIVVVVGGPVPAGPLPSVSRHGRTHARVE